jgi:DNA-binding beta-propeller fold protein YncE
VQNVVIPIDLVTQQAERPIDIPGQGATHAIVVLPGGHTVLAASGSTIVPVDVDRRTVGQPLQLGAGDTIYGLALDPVATTAYALVPGGVVPVDTANGTAGATIPTGLTVSSVYSPHGIAVTDDGATVYVVGQGPPDFGGRVLPITTSTGATGTPASFDNYGIADPAALAVEPDGSSLLVADSANNWINPVPLATFTNPPQPVRLPPQAAGEPSSGTQHPTDIVLDPSGTSAYVVEGFDAVLPYDPASQTFGRAIPVCTGASSMAVAPSP